MFTSLSGAVVKITLTGISSVGTAVSGQIFGYIVNMLKLASIALILGFGFLLIRWLYDQTMGSWSHPVQNKYKPSKFDEPGTF